MEQLPETQRAVQLIGPDELVFNAQKKIVKPGAHQIVCKVEAVGLCFSDLKLLKQFSNHARKTEILSGIDLDILKEISSYVPEQQPTVPGHEGVVRIVETGPGVKTFAPGERYLVQTDYRWLLTENSNGAFGYNLEGALQEYVLLDERVITSPQGESMLIAVSEQLSASAIALIEPWACVENAYATRERQGVKANGKMLIVADVEVDVAAVLKFFDKYGRGDKIVWVGDCPKEISGEVVDNTADLPDAVFDDVIYFGAGAETTEQLFSKVGPRGLFNIVQSGGKFGRAVTTAIGRVHYGGIRIIGTAGNDPAESMERIPATGEIRPGDKINVVGAAGPMGMMHVIRNICQGVEGVTVFAGDVDDDRLKVLRKIVEPIAKKNNIELNFYNAKNDKLQVKFDYTVLMAPIPALVAGAIKESADGAIVNVFAGIPASVSGEMDLDAYIAGGMYVIGTSGSTLEDMKTVLAKVESGRLDTNTSLAAVCGLESAVEGIRAVENRSISGKILVYPAKKNLPLTTLEQLKEKMPEVAANLANGLWTKKAEDILLS